MQLKLSAQSIDTLKLENKTLVKPEIFSSLLESDSAHLLKEVLISGFQSNPQQFTSLNIESFDLKEMNQKTPYNLSDALATLPGIAQISTGNGISKPAIRGLFGNRILVLLSGNRFDNQQFQDEHGLGLSQIGIDRVEVIKGPASLLYGSDALGGIINVIEEKPIKTGKHWNYNTQIYTNAPGSLTDVGYQFLKEKKWLRMRVGMEEQADYADGNHLRVLNSRMQGYYLKLGAGFQKGNWKMENSYNGSFTNYGFIMEDFKTAFTPDARFSIKMNNLPHHLVALNILNSQNTFYLKRSMLKWNLGVQSNSRREDEGGGSISLNMHLVSFLHNLKWEKVFNEHWETVLNSQVTIENNTNYGGRKIIPDAWMFESNASVYLKYHTPKLIVESGLGINQKQVKTLLTIPINQSGEVISAFSKNRMTPNGMFGMCLQPFSSLFIKSNVASGFRAGNLAELSSNGVHEGVYRYEIGNPNLKLEKNINTDLTLEWSKKAIFLSASLFYNRFFDYIYLAPSNELFYGFKKYYFKQQNAVLKGYELQLIMKPPMLKMLEWKSSLVKTTGTLADGDYLPFIAPLKLISSVRYAAKFKKGVELFFEPEWQYVFSQLNPAKFETRSYDYFLISSAIGLTLPRKNGNWQFGIHGMNLTNTVYSDHLSRLKDYGINNSGRNLALSIRKNF